MIWLPEDENKDEIINVELPRRDYQVLREIIDDRQTMKGVKRFLVEKVFWFTGGLISIVGLYEIFRRYG